MVKAFLKSASKIQENFYGYDFVREFLLNFCYSNFDKSLKSLEKIKNREILRAKAYKGTGLMKI